MIDQVYNNGDIASGNNIGGIAGYLYHGNTNAYNRAEIIGNDRLVVSLRIDM